jgi:hypothetical protein
MSSLDVLCYLVGIVEISNNDLTRNSNTERPAHFLFGNGQTLLQYFNLDRVIKNPAPTVGQRRVSSSRQVKAASAVCISCLSA